MLRLWARSPVGGMGEATYPCISHSSMFLFLSFSLPSSLSFMKPLRGKFVCDYFLQNLLRQLPQRIEKPVNRPRGIKDIGTHMKGKAKTQAQMIMRNNEITL